MYKICLLSLAMVSACNNAGETKKVSKQQAKSIRQKKAIAQLRLIDLNDRAIDLEKFKGKTIFINFWATWCKPCLEEMPSIAKAMEVLKNEDIVFLFASEETPQEIEQFKNINNYPFQYVRVENPAELNIMALPTTFIFDSEGSLVFSEMGYRKWDEKKNIDIILNIGKSK